MVPMLMLMVVVVVAVVRVLMWLVLQCKNNVPSEAEVLVLPETL